MHRSNTLVRRSSAFLAAAVVMLSAGAARAATVTYAFAGTSSLSDPVTGTLSFNYAATDSPAFAGDTSFAVYEGAIGAVSVTYQGNTYTNSPAPGDAFRKITVNDSGAFDFAQFHVSLGSGPSTFTLTISGQGGDAFSGDAIPTAAQFDSLTSKTFNLVVNSQQVQGTITSVTDAPAAPLPASAWGGLALMGGLGSARLARHRRRNAAV